MRSGRGRDAGCDATWYVGGCRELLASSSLRTAKGGKSGTFGPVGQLGSAAFGTCNMSCVVLFLLLLIKVRHSHGVEGAKVAMAAAEVPSPSLGLSRLSWWDWLDCGEVLNRSWLMAWLDPSTASPPFPATPLPPPAPHCSGSSKVSMVVCGVLRGSLTSMACSQL